MNYYNKFDILHNATSYYDLCLSLEMSAEEKEDYEKAKSEGLNDLVDDEEEKVMEQKKVKEERKEKTLKK